MHMMIFIFCPNWDEILHKEINKIGHNNFYLSGTMMNNGQIPFDCGNDIVNFNEKNFYLNIKTLIIMISMVLHGHLHWCIETYGIK